MNSNNFFSRMKLQSLKGNETILSLLPGCATSVLVTSAGMGEMVMQVLVGSVSEEYFQGRKHKRKLISEISFLIVPRAISFPQIMQTKGSYSFLLCGMIIACIGFILFIGLLLFHRMHRNYLAGTSLASASSTDAPPLISPPSLISYPSAPSNLCSLCNHRNNEKVCHGRGASHGAEWIRQNRTERGERDQLRSSLGCLCRATLAVFERRIHIRIQFLA